MNFVRVQTMFKYHNYNEVKAFFINKFLIMAKVRNNQVFVFWN